MADYYRYRRGEQVLHLELPKRYYFITAIHNLSVGRLRVEEFSEVAT
jgi:hypothetical protein